MSCHDTRIQSSYRCNMPACDARIYDGDYCADHDNTIPKGISRALIIKGQHLFNVFRHGKDWEMRSKRTTIRGRIGLIESGSGHIVGEAILADCLPPLTEAMREGTRRHHKVQDLNLLEKWRYPWVLESIIHYKTPKPYTHPRGAVVWVRL